MLIMTSMTLLADYKLKMVTDYRMLLKTLTNY